MKNLLDIIYQKIVNFWNGPETLPSRLKLEWKLVPIRWLGIVFVSSGLLLADLTPTQFSGAYAILILAAIYNISVQLIFKRRPEILLNGYLTTFADAALTIVMLLLLGGFNSPYYYMLYSLAMSTAMRYGNRPASFLILLLIGADFFEGLISQRNITAPFIVRSTFLVITAILAVFLRDQAKEEAALKERLDAQDKMVRDERLAVLGKMASGVAHELRNPLTGISNATYYLKSVLADSDKNIKKHLSIISKEVMESDKIITDLLDFAQIESSNTEIISVGDIIDDSLKRVSFPADVKITSGVSSDLPPINVDGEQIKRVIINLIINAIQAMPEGGELKINASFKEDRIKISIADTGVGIKAENLEKIFQPLFTTKLRGIGLGLAIS